MANYYEKIMTYFSSGAQSLFIHSAIEAVEIQVLTIIHADWG